jgi:flagellar export protein FliJ
MLTARQRRKIVENLRVKQHAHHQRAEWREEQKLLDDLASRRGRPILAWKPEEAAL